MSFTPDNINALFFFSSCSSEVYFCNPQHSAKVNRKGLQPVGTETWEGVLVLAPAPAVAESP